MVVLRDVDFETVPVLVVVNEFDAVLSHVTESVDVLDNERDAVVVFDTLPDPDSMDWLVDSVREALRECVLERDTL